MVNLSASTASFIEALRTHIAPARPYHEHLIRRVANARRVIRIAWLLVLLSILSHSARIFGGFEEAGPLPYLTSVSAWAGLFSALALDAGLAALIMSNSVAVSRGFQSRLLITGIVFFSVVSAGANLLYAAQVKANEIASLAAFVQHQYTVVASLALFAVSLPFLMMFLAAAEVKLGAIEYALRGGELASIEGGASLVSITPASPIAALPSVSEADSRPHALPGDTRQVRQRRRRMLALIEAEPTVSIHDLSHSLKTSRATVQRDLQAMNLHWEAGQWTRPLEHADAAPASDNGRALN